MVESYDICVIGTGAGGGILAYRLAKAGLKVISLEQGGSVSPGDFSNMVAPQNKHFSVTPRTQFPIDEDSFLFDHEFYARQEARSESLISQHCFRNYQVFRLNGKLNLWGGVALRFSERDFGSWPLRYSDLEPHYSAIEKLIGVTGSREGLETLPDGEFIPPKELRPVDRILKSSLEKSEKEMGIKVIYNRKAVETRKDRVNCCPSCGGCIQGCQTNSVYKFSNYLLPEISRLENYKLILNAKCTQLHKDPESNQLVAVDYLDTLTKQTHQVKSKIFILAAGGLETPRILLNSKLANRSGLVGCFLQDNPKAIATTSFPQLWFSQAPYDIGYGDLLLVVPAKYLHQDQLLFAAQWGHTYFKEPLYINFLQSFPRWLHPWIARRIFKSCASLVMFAPSDPERNNRVALSEERDAYGIRKVDIHFKHTSKEERDKKRMLDLGCKIIKKCYGAFVEKGDCRAGTGIHYAGTCRMARSSSEGVVDSDLRTFDHPNLFICDGSVFPDIPEKHLTLTIMALADRLAQYLQY